MKYYNATAQGFYDDEIHTTIPEGSVAVSDEAYVELMTASSQSKVIVPDADGNPVMQDYMTEEEIASNNAVLAVKQAKLTGVEFEGVMCSATKEDMWGLNAVQSFITAGNDVNFEFDNGNVLLLTPTNYEAFTAVWVPFRSSFF